MRIAVGSDPNAADLKYQMIEFMKSLGHEITDFGSDDPIYAHVAISVAEAVAAKKYDRGVLFCGTGLGVMLAANKVHGCYAAVLNDEYSAERACLSNNCNVVTIGSQVTGSKKAEKLLGEYLKNQYVYTDRSGPKVEAIVEYENQHFRDRKKTADV